MIGLIDVGGGMRGIFGAGVLDYCILNDIAFDYGIGVSAGAANIVSYIAKQYHRNYVFYTEYSQRKEYMSTLNLLKTGNYLNLDYIYSTLTNSDGENPLDYETVKASDMTFKIVATRAEDATSVFFDKSDLKQDNYDVIKASCCVPFINKPYVIDGVPYYDGGIMNPIPVQHALDAGCERILVILTKPKDFRMKESSGPHLMARLSSDHAEFHDAIQERGSKYNEQLERALELEKEGIVEIIAPDDIGHENLTRDPAKLDALYQEGLLSQRSF